jgi:hypothetical protein
MARAFGNRNIDRDWVGVFLLGAGVGVAAVLLLSPGVRSRLRSLLDGAGDAAVGLGAIGRREPNAWRDRKQIRRERTLGKKIDRMRSAGY